MDYLKEYNAWIKNSLMDDETKNELMKIKEDEREIKERFSKHLEFGTGGLRGIIGAGTNRMNKYVVRKTTQGIADYIAKYAGEEGKKRGVVMAYDCRCFSDLFAFEAASVMVANGIVVYLFDSLRPTPELSFAVRHLKAIAGINITASHNPASYNGYKVYWEDGGQLPPHVSDVVLEMINKAPLFSPKIMSRQQMQKSGLFNIIGQAVDDAYTEAVYKQAINKYAAKQAGDKFKLVYTPLHGAGNIPVRTILKKAGFNNVLVVKEQEQPDGSFSTVKSPNPEERESFELAILLAKKHDANLIIGTDPDGDRVGVVVRNRSGEYVMLSGNQVGALLAHYILASKKENGSLPENAAVISTIVSTKMTEKICEKFNVKLFNTLTGFKFFAEKILDFEKTQSYKYIFGFEESYGYLAGDHARDKDAVVTSMLIAEMAAYYYGQGKTLLEVMEDLYKEYGGFAEETISIKMEGIDGIARMKDMMQQLRNNIPEKIASFDVIAVRDYKASIRYDMVHKAETKLDLPTSDVLYFELSEGANFVVRPSGTEPKIKLYYLVEGKTPHMAKEVLERTKKAVLHSLRFK
jgi:phosphoglucomutase